MIASDELAPDILHVRVPVATVWTSPRAPRDLDAPAILDRPDLAGWAAGMDTPTRRGLVGRTLTQALLGERIQVLAEQDDWLRVVCLEQPASGDDRGYPGWMRRAHLGTPAPHTPLVASVIDRSTCLSRSDSSTADLSFGTRLAVVDVSAQTAAVLLPNGASGTVPLSDVALARATHQTACRPEDALDLARLFLGLRYLWGGTTSWGLDCSGLVHLVHRAIGVTIPRDASDQAVWDQIEPVALTAVEAGDLYFFARPEKGIHHVGFASRPFHGDGERWMLHAPEAGTLIEDARMAPHHAETLVSAGRVRNRHSSNRRHSPA